MVKYKTVKYSTVEYSTVKYSTVEYSQVWSSTIQYIQVQYSQVPSSTVGLQSSPVPVQYQSSTSPVPSRPVPSRPVQSSPVQYRTSPVQSSPVSVHIIMIIGVKPACSYNEHRLPHGRPVHLNSSTVVNCAIESRGLNTGEADHE